jgi:hypothetical protein
VNYSDPSAVRNRSSASSAHLRLSHNARPYRMGLHAKASFQQPHLHKHFTASSKTEAVIDVICACTTKSSFENTNHVVCFLVSHLDIMITIVSRQTSSSPMAYIAQTPLFTVDLCPLHGGPLTVHYPIDLHTVPCNASPPQTSA